MTAEKLPDHLISYLRQCGLSSARADACNFETRLYHDLGVYGDEAQGYVDELKNGNNVDMSKFVFDDYFPQEIPATTIWGALICQLFPSRAKLLRDRLAYAPLPLRLIDQAIRRGQWQD